MWGKRSPVVNHWASVPVDRFFGAASLTILIPTDTKFKPQGVDEGGWGRGFDVPVKHQALRLISGFSSRALGDGSAPERTVRGPQPQCGYQVSTTRCTVVVTYRTRFHLDLSCSRHNAPPVFPLWFHSPSIIGSS